MTDCRCRRRGSESTTVTLQPAFRQVSATLLRRRARAHDNEVDGHDRDHPVGRALCADGGRLVTEVYEQSPACSTNAVGPQTKMRGRRIGEGDRSQHLGVDSPCESAPVRRHSRVKV
jgi:hypothetical protein